MNRTGDSIDNVPLLVARFPDSAAPVLDDIGPLIASKRLQYAFLASTLEGDEELRATQPYGAIAIPRSLAEALFSEHRDDPPSSIRQLFFQNDTCYLEVEKPLFSQDEIWVKWTDAIVDPAKLEIYYQISCASDNELTTLAKSVVPDDADRRHLLGSDGTESGINLRSFPSF